MMKKIQLQNVDAANFIYLSEHRVHCGSGQEWDLEHPEFALSLHQKFIQNPASTFAMQVEGDCMSPTLLDRDFILVDQSLSPRLGQVVLWLYEGEFFVRRFFRKGEMVILKADNVLYPDKILAWDEFGLGSGHGILEIRGVVVSVHRSLVS